MNLRDKVVVITGSSKGFGKSLAKAFDKSGSKVVISSANEDELKSTSAELGVDFKFADVTSFGDLTDLSKFTVNKYQKIDIWINNAGIQIAPSNVEDVDLEKLHKLYDVNFFGYFYSTKAVLPQLIKQNSGTIININSTAGLNGKPGLSAYSSSKFAIKGFTESLREELKGTGIKVMGVFPGGMQTEIYKEKYPDDFDDYMSVDYAIDKVIGNLISDNPELDLIIRRPNKA